MVRRFLASERSGVVNTFRWQTQAYSMANFHGISARSRIDALHYGVANAKNSAVQKIIEDGVDIDGIGPDGGSALHVAAQLGRFKAAEILLAAGPNLDLHDKFGCTPLMTACHNGGTNGSRVAILMLEYGADVKLRRTTDDLDALSFATRKGTGELIVALLDAGSPINGPRGCSLTPLMLAARAGNVEALQILVDRGANLKRKCKLPWANGATAEVLAEMERRTKSIKFFRNL